MTPFRIQCRLAGMALPLQRQLLDAFNVRKRRDGLTFEALLLLCKLEISSDSLSRKLRGLQPIEAKEVEAIATAMGVEVRAGRAIRKAA